MVEKEKRHLGNLSLRFEKHYQSTISSNGNGSRLFSYKQVWSAKCPPSSLCEDFQSRKTLDVWLFLCALAQSWLLKHFI